MNGCLEALSKINKSDIDERQFYEQVMSAIQKLEGLSLTDESFIQLKETLQRIGCVDQATWEKEKIERGEQIKDIPPIWEGMETAPIETAVNFVSQLLGETSRANFALGMIFEWGGPKRWVDSSIAQRGKTSTFKSKGIGEKIKAGIVQADKDMEITYDEVQQSKKTFDRILQKVFGRGSKNVERDDER